MRAYFFGNMYLSSIQQGIQAAHDSHTYIATVRSENGIVLATSARYDRMDRRKYILLIPTEAWGRFTRQKAATAGDDVNDILNRAADLARMMARTFLHATVWRVVWSLPLLTVLGLAAIIFFSS